MSGAGQVTGDQILAASKAFPEISTPAYPLATDDAIYTPIQPLSALSVGSGLLYAGITRYVFCFGSTGAFPVMGSTSRHNRLPSESCRRSKFSRVMVRSMIARVLARVQTAPPREPAAEFAWLMS